ncbi:MAG: DUF3990 domain-containing protein [Clostridia bacterium]|nr:DUF3990 domain-containing protein [Clostridia bacterium]
MILYHGSDVKVDNPIIIKFEKGKDFGCAFYLTPIKEQAERMAKRKQRMNKSKSAIVSVFECNEKEFSNMKYKAFKNPDLEWLDMIIKCRTNPSFIHGYDIVEGKIADDSVGETILFVIDGIIKKEDAIERLKFQKINSQIAFCSEQSLKLLKSVTSYEVK